MALWVSVSAIAVVGGLGVALVVWLVRSEVQERRRARFVAGLAARYRTAQPVEPESEAEPEPDEAAGRMVTVEELVERIEAEGLPVRLRWSEEDEVGGGGAGGEDWPTGVLGRIDNGER